MFKKLSAKLLSLFVYVCRWALMVFPVAIIIGGLVGLFLWLLGLVTHYRFAHPWLLYLLPLAGVAIHFLYKIWGSSSERGNNLIIDEIHQPGAGVPRRMAPLILFTTVFTHLFGGSAGREGTAVQIGGSIANAFSGLFRLSPASRSVLLTAGMAAGFGAVFGTPLTGAVFAMEVVTAGSINYTAALPCLMAAFTGDYTVTLLGIHHTAYHIAVIPNQATGGYLPAPLLLILKVSAAAAVFGLSARMFAMAAHHVKKLTLLFIKPQWLIPVLGACTIIGLTFLVGKPDYLGLGVEPQYPGAVTIISAFHQAGATAFSWLWKLVFTAITLGTGFKGGEVTPLFYIGATLGNTLAQVMNAPVGLFAALGFISVFAGATKTPVACILMGAELFGPQHILLFGVACCVAVICSGNMGIYTAQRKADVHFLKIMYRKALHKR